MTNMDVGNSDLCRIFARWSESIKHVPNRVATSKLTRNFCKPEWETTISTGIDAPEFCQSKARCLAQIKQSEKISKSFVC